MNTYLKLIVPYFISVIVLIIVACVFMAPQFSNKTLVGEGVQNTAMSKEADTYFKKTGEYTRWSNSMFGGMPTYVTYGGGKAGLADYYNSVLKGFRTDSLGYFLLFLLAAYLGFLFLGVGPWLALLGALAAGFATSHIGILEASHNSKLASSSLTIMAMAGIYRLFKKDYIIGGVSFSLALTLSLGGGHPQMTYYFLLACGVLSLAFIYTFIRQKQWKELGKVMVILIAGAVVALGSNLYQTITVRSFSADTMRGGAILSSAATKGQSASLSESSEAGLGFQYAMQWSDGWRDLLAMVIPGAVGGSNVERVKDNKSINTLLRSSGFQPQPFLPLYWGSLSFTGSPDYMGAIIILLFILGLFIVKGPAKWGIVAATALLVLMSLGKNFEAFNRFLFDNLPFLNKFRTPNSIHNVTSCLVPLFAIFSLHQLLLVQDKKAILSLMSKIVAVLAGFILLFGFGGSIFFDFTSPADGRYDPTLVSVLKSARAIYMRQDAMRTLLFLIMGSVVLYFYLTDRLKKNYMILGLTLLTFFDLFGIAKRYLSIEDWKPKTAITNGNPMRPVDQQILQDPQLYYRVLDLNGDPFQDASASFYHKSIGGYHPAKLRRYQDIIDTYLAKGDQKMINMLNTKYIINQNQEAQQNPAAMGNAWYIRQFKKVTNPDEEIAAIQDIDPLETAIVLDSEFPGYITTNEYSKSGSITLTKYEPNALTYSAQAEGEQFAVFSDIWFGPNKGWQAYIDGKPVDHIRVNYLLRGLKIPSGSHVIEFKFVPTKVLRSIALGFWLNNLAGLAFLILIGWLVYQDFKKVNAAPQATTVVATRNTSGPKPKTGKGK